MYAHSAVTRSHPASLDSPIGLRIARVSSSLGLHPVAAAILAEVCRMKEFANRHQCDASNGHFHKATGCHPVTASKHLKVLNTAGWVSYPVTKGRGRVIHPAPLLEEIYHLEDESILSRSLANLSRILSQMPSILSRSLAGTLADMDAILSQTAPEIDSAKDTAKQTVRTITENPTDRSLVEDLQQELSVALATCEELKAEILRLTEDRDTWKRSALAEGHKFATEVIARQDAEAGREADREAARRVVASRDKAIAELKAQQEGQPKRKAPAAPKSKRTVEPPTEEQVLAYMLEQRPNNPRADVVRVAARCYGHYTAKDWKSGRDPIVNWKGSCQVFLADLPKIAPKAEEPTTPIAERTGQASDQQREMLRLKNANLTNIR